MSAPLHHFAAIRWIWLTWSLSACCFAQTLDVSQLPDRYAVGGYAQYFEDPTLSLTIAEARARFLAGEATQADGNNLTFGYSSSAYWIRLAFAPVTAETEPRLLELAYPVIDAIEAHFYSGGVALHSLTMGDKKPFAERPLAYRNFVFELPLQPQQPLEVYLRVKTSSSVQVPLVVWRSDHFSAESQQELMWLGIYYGAMLVMVLYNLFIFFSVREASYFYYVMYVLCMVTFIGSLNGITYQYLWPESIWWNDQSLVFCLGGVLLFACLFVRNFLSLPESQPRFNQVFSVFSVMLVGIILASLLLPYRIMIICVILAAVVVLPCLIYAGILRWREGFEPARYYTVAWAAIIFGGLTLAFNKFGLLPRNGFTENGVQIGSAVEVVLLSFALAARLNNERRMRSAAQSEALVQERAARQAQETALQHEREARQAQEQALSVQTHANELLERRVKLRTQELEDANRKLRELSATDGLTGLKNRRYFDECFQFEAHRAVRGETRLAIVLLDVDYFKQLNDEHGHLVGDECLKRIARCLQAEVRDNIDTLARYGGEEFVLLMPQTDAHNALDFAERLRRGVERMDFRVDNARVHVTISLGVSVAVPTTIEQAQQILEQADRALYLAKAQGRNRAQLMETHAEATD